MELGTARRERVYRDVFANTLGLNLCFPNVHWLCSTFPNKDSDSVCRAENLIQHIQKWSERIVANVDHYHAVLREKLTQQREPRIHHAEPAVMAVEGLAFAAYGVADPFANGRAVDVIIITPVFVAGVVRGVDADALHLALVVRQQSLERHEVVPFDDQVPAARITTG